MAAGPTIDYEALQQDAMRGVVRAALNLIAKTGLPGDHHFYVSFLTQAPGVVLSKRLKEIYPHEMTIVLQHRFWDLLVSEDRFEVKLTFDGIPERLVVPFAAIKVFIDPSVRFGLQFEEGAGAGECETPNARRTQVNFDGAYDQVGEANLDSPRATLAKKPRAPRKAKSEKETGAGAQPSAAPPDTAAPRPQPAAASAPDRSPDADDEKPAAQDSGAKILSLDQFRKK